MPVTSRRCKVKRQTSMEASVSQITAKPLSSARLWRAIGWGGAVALLIAPFIAMQLHADGVDWSAGDFLFAAALFATVGGLLELAIKLTPNASYRAAVALALLGGLLVIWSNLAVGIVGSEHDPLNRLFFAALLVGIVTAWIGRFRWRAMSWAMLATAASLGIAFAINVGFGSGESNASHWIELTAVSLSALIFVGSAILFRRAGHRQSSSSS